MNERFLTTGVFQGNVFIQRGLDVRGLPAESVALARKESICSKTSGISRNPVLNLGTEKRHQRFCSTFRGHSLLLSFLELSVFSFVHSVLLTERKRRPRTKGSLGLSCRLEQEPTWFL